ncbi:MAG: class B sortase [Oscillospiraceae bacterium]|nr:class B sortase [Oscillospiraceae bacterium]
MLKFWKQLNILYERLLLIVLCLIFGIVLWCMYDNWYVYSYTLDDRVRKYKPGTSGAVASEDSPILDDMAAWITIDGTNIDYPVMQGTDNVRYLNTNPFGEYALSGSIYLDCRSSKDFSDPYSLVYGHHMEYGKMFGALDDFLNPSYLAHHKTGTLIIGKNAAATYPLEVFAAMCVSSDNNLVFNPEQNGIREYIAEQTGYPVQTRGENIIALSTCAEGGSSARIIVFCFILN